MDVLSIATSGMQAASMETSVTANNVANAQTPGYRAQRLDLEDQAQGGVQPAALRESGEAGTPDGSNVDYVLEMTNLMAQTQQFDANVRVVQTQNQMLGKILDLNA